MVTMNILITGATGFIGNAFVQALINEKDYYNIYCAVRKSSKRENLEKLGVNFINFNLEDFSTFTPAVSNMDIVIHFAAYFDFRGEEEKLIFLNAEATKELARVCLKAKVKHFVYCSSTEAIGVVVDGTESSDYNPDGKYGKSKMIAELTLLEMKEKEGLPLTIVRPSGVFGPGDFYVITEFIESMDKTILNKIVPNSGKNLIHFTYIDDIIDGFLKIIKQPEKSVNNTYILSSDFSQTFKYLVDTILLKLNRKTPIYISFFPNFLIRLIWPFIWRYYNRKGLGFPFIPNAMDKLDSSRSYRNNKAKKELGFNPKVDYETGIENTVRWMKEIGILKK